MDRQFLCAGSINSGLEVMFDNYKNYLDTDVSYIQNRYVMEGWLFANFIAMMAYYKCTSDCDKPSASRIIPFMPK